jgi:hypothetical protein
MCLVNYLSQPENRHSFEQFVEGKFGYGAWEAPYWFVGPEEGGGGNCVELTDRLVAWDRHAHDDPQYAGLLNLRDYCKAINQPQFLGVGARPQSTWIKLLSLLGQPGTENGPPAWFANEPVAEPGRLGNWKLLFQRRFLCQPDVPPHGRRVALLEISPLPSPKTGVWLWGCIAAEPVEQLHHQEFQSRETFLSAIGDNGATRICKRLETLNNHLHRCHPTFVIFYGLFGEAGAMAMA